MDARRLFMLGLGGTAVTAACCFTPVLVWLFAVLGVTAWLAWADLVLWPLLLVSATMTVIAALRLRRRGRATAPATVERQ